MRLFYFFIKVGLLHIEELDCFMVMLEQKKKLKILLSVFVDYCLRAVGVNLADNGGPETYAWDFRLNVS